MRNKKLSCASLEVENLIVRWSVNLEQMLAELLAVFRAVRSLASTPPPAPRPRPSLLSHIKACEILTGRWPFCSRKAKILKFLYKLQALCLPLSKVMGESQEPDSSEEGNSDPSSKKRRIGGTIATTSRSRGQGGRGGRTVAQQSSEHREDSAAETGKVEGLDTDADRNAPRHQRGLRDRAKGNDISQINNQENDGHEEGHDRLDLRSRAVIEPSPAASRSEVIVVDGGGGREERTTGKSDDSIERDNAAEGEGYSQTLRGFDEAEGMNRREEDAVAVSVAVTPRPGHLPDPDSLRACLEKYMEVRVS